MKKYLRAISLLSSVVFSAVLLLFFLGWQGYTPATVSESTWAYGICMVIIILYGAIEWADTITTHTATPWEVAQENFFSQFPMYALVFIAARWWDGFVVVSQFQVLVGGVSLAVILLDNLGFFAIIAQRLYLTDEAKLAK